MPIRKLEMEIDSLGNEKERAQWVFCGQFPLLEISRGRRACRRGWRIVDKDSIFDMLAVVKCEENNKNKLGLERESETAIEDTDSFSDIDDMLAKDWFLEVEN